METRGVFWFHCQLDANALSGSYRAPDKVALLLRRSRRSKFSERLHATKTAVAHRASDEGWAVVLLMHLNTMWFVCLVRGCRPYTSLAEYPYRKRCDAVPQRPSPPFMGVKSDRNANMWNQQPRPCLLSSTCYVSEGLLAVDTKTDCCLWGKIRPKLRVLLASYLQ